MTRTDFGAVREQAEKDGSIPSGGGYFKLQDGDNRIRIVAGPLPHPGEYNGKPNFKWLFQVIDRTDGQVKPFFMSPVIFDQLADIQRDPDWTFDGVPLPFDINIKTTNAGKLTARYTITPAPTRKSITAAEQDAIDAATPLAEFQKKIREKGGQHTEKPFDPDSIPF